MGKSVIHIPHRCKQFTRTPGRQGYVCLCTRTHAEQVRSVNHTKFDSLSHDISRSKPSSPTSTKADRQQDATRRGGGVPEALAIAAVWRAWYCLPWPAPYARYDCQHAETAGIHCRQIAAGNDNKHAPSAGMICR